MSDDTISKWKTKRTIQQLAGIKGNGTSMVTLAIPSGAQINLYGSKLTEELGTASNIKSRVNRLSVLSAITSAQHQLKGWRKTPPNGLLVYCGIGMASDSSKEKKINISFEPQKPIHTSLYLCDSIFHTEMLEDLLQEHETFGFLIVDGNGCYCYSVTGDHYDLISSKEVQLPKKHHKGGQSSVRFARLRTEAIHNYIRKVCEMATAAYITKDVSNVAGLILAGSADMKSLVEKSDLLDKRLKKIIIATLDISYGGEMGLKQAVQHASGVLSNLRIVQERQVCLEFFDHIAKDTGLYFFGDREADLYMEMGAVKKLLVWDQLPTRRVQCQGGRVLFLKPAAQIPQDAIVEEEGDYLEWLVDNYDKRGVEKLELVTDNSGEGKQFCMGFGGIGGILRWAAQIEDDLEDAEADDAEDSDLEDFI